MAAYTGAGRVLRREEQIRINQAIGSCGFSMLNLGAYLSGANDEEKGATVFAVQSTRKLSRTEYSITINDEAGAGFAIANGINSASLVMSVSETMNVRRFGITRTVSFRQLKAVAAVLKSGGVMTDLQLSTVFGCPFEGKMNDGIVLQLIDYFCLLGIDGVTLRDSSGAASPTETAALCRRLRQDYPHLTITLHLSDATGRAAQNTCAAAGEGVTRFGLTGRELAVSGSMNMKHLIETSLKYIAEVEHYGFTTEIDTEKLGQVSEYALLTEV
nr:hypothetical protein [Klebsiella quasipneumoniae]